MSAGDPEPANGGDDDAAEADFDRAFQLSELGRYREAAALALRGLTNRPESVHGLNILAFVQSRLDDHETARATSERALAIDPESAWANYTRGIVLWSDGDGESALECFDRAIELWPESAYMHAIKAELLGALDRPEEGLTEIGVALAMEPESVAHRIEKIDLLRALEQHGAADDLVEEVLRLAPDALEVHRRVADTALRQDRPADAERWFKTALAADPNDEWTRESLAEAIRQRARQRVSLSTTWCVGLILLIWTGAAKLVEAGLLSLPGFAVVVIVAFAGTRLGRDWLVVRHALASAVIPKSERLLRGATLAVAPVATFGALSHAMPFRSEVGPVMDGAIVVGIMIVIARFALSPTVRGFRQLLRETRAGDASRADADAGGASDGGKRQ